MLWIENSLQELGRLPIREKVPMNSDRSSPNDVVARDVESYRKFLAGGKTLFAQAFWETSAPRRGEDSDDGVEVLDIGVEEGRN